MCYRRCCNGLDSHAVREAGRSVWVEASLHSHRFSAVKVLLSFARSPRTRLVLLSEQISIVCNSTAKKKKTPAQTCTRVLHVAEGKKAHACTANAVRHADTDCSEEPASALDPHLQNLGCRRHDKHKLDINLLTGRHRGCVLGWNTVI